jgi:hypothetical protein
MAERKTAIVLMATYNDWDLAVDLLMEIDHELHQMGFAGQVVVVDDGSTAVDSRDDIPSLKFKAIEQVDVVEAFRNHGNQRAQAIGIAYCAENCSGDYLVIMDSDHEDKAEYISQLIEACSAHDDRKIVFAERSKRSEGRQFTAFYGLYRFAYRLLTGVSISIGNFSAMPWSFVKKVANIAELWSHYPASVMRARLPFASITSERGTRLRGQSKMSLVPLVIHALSGFSVHAETVGVRIILLAMVAGLVTAGLALVAMLLKLFTNIPIVGWTSQVVGLLAIMLVLLIITMTIMVFLVISVRLQTPMIPMHDYKKFVASVSRLYPVE